MNPHPLAGTVADLKAHGIEYLLVFCCEHACKRQGKMKLGNYFDHTTLESIRKAMYCSDCRKAGCDDRNLDIRPQWPIVSGPRRKSVSTK